MEKVIVFKNDRGGVSIVIPTLDAISLYGIDAIARKDVPFGKPYKIVNIDEIPADRTFRDAWSIDEALLVDGVGSIYDTFDEILND